jgi:TetR/AcrR family transcriptional regulator, lmrAB and yxaGH operons repressor
MASSEGTRARFIETTSRLLHARGYQGTSLTEILAESGAPRGSLYYHFPGGKDELVREATLRSIEAISEFLRECFSPQADPVAAVRQYAGEAARELAESNFVLGCPVAPLILDGVEGHELGRLCREAMTTWQAIITGRLAAEGLSRDRSASFSSLLVSAIEGALLTSRALRDTRPLDQVGEELSHLLQLLLDEQRS